jgi:hypothetical protein
MTSYSTVKHPADSFKGLSDAHVIGKHLTPKSKVPSSLSLRERNSERERVY